MVIAILFSENRDCSFDILNSLSKIMLSLFNKDYFTTTYWEFYNDIGISKTISLKQKGIEKNTL